jgi:hypothetical protein
MILQNIFIVVKELLEISIGFDLVMFGSILLAFRCISANFDCIPAEVALINLQLASQHSCKLE